MHGRARFGLSQVAWPAALAAALGCAPDRAEAPVQAVADVRLLMAAVIEPAAEIYWDAVGTIIDTTGTYELAPSTGEEWAAVRNAALVVAESGNLLMMEGRARDRGAWQTLSRALVDVGRQAVAAAESRNRDSVFAVGGQLYEACTACHAAYALETLRPSDPRQAK